MPSNIWSLFISGSNDSSPSRYLPIMHWVILSVILLVSSCHADDNASYSKADIMKQAEDNIRWLRQAKERVEREEKKNSLATLTDLMIKDSFDSQLMSKMDILYDNQTDLNKELKFVPQVFNCGKEFDIFKVLELAKAHRNITTEQPPCIVDVDDNMCTTKKANGGSNNNKNMRYTSTPQSRDPATNGINAYAIQAAISTKVPQGHPAAEKRTEPALFRQPSANPQTKTAKLKPQNKDKTSSLEKDTGVKIAPSLLQEHLEMKGPPISSVVGYRRFGAEPFLNEVQVRENPHYLEELPQSWYPAQLAQNEAQQYSPIENHNENGVQVKLLEPLSSKPEAPSESLQPQMQSAQLPIIPPVLQQNQGVEQSATSQLVQQSHVNIVETPLQKQPGLEQTPSEKRDSIGQGDQKLGLIDKTKQELENNVSSSITQTQQQPQQLIKLAKQAPVQQSLIQPQFSISTQQQSQALGKQDQPFQNAEQHNQQFQSFERQNQQQLQTAEEQKQQQLQTVELQKHQKFHTSDQQKRQEFQTGEQLTQQQLFSSEQQKIQTAEKQKQEFPNMEKHNQQLQTIEKLPPAIIPAVTDSEPRQPQMVVVPSSQHQAAQKTSYSASDQQQTFFPSRMEQNQQAAKPLANPFQGTSAQQAAQKPDSQNEAKLPSEASNKGLSEVSGNKALNNNSDKTMLSAPINVMVMDPNLNLSRGNTISKVNLVPGNIPATAYFWGYTMANTPKVQNHDTLKTETNKAASGSNKLESSNVSGNIQENPKEDYVYYQDQD